MRFLAKYEPKIAKKKVVKYESLKTVRDALPSRVIAALASQVHGWSPAGWPAPLGWSCLHWQEDERKQVS